MSHQSSSSSHQGLEALAALALAAPSMASSETCSTSKNIVVTDGTSSTASTTDTNTAMTGTNNDGALFGNINWQQLLAQVNGGNQPVANPVPPSPVAAAAPPPPPAGVGSQLAILMQQLASNASMQQQTAQNVHLYQSLLQQPGVESTSHTGRGGAGFGSFPGNLGAASATQRYTDTSSLPQQQNASEFQRPHTTWSQPPIATATIAPAAFGRHGVAAVPPTNIAPQPGTASPQPSSGSGGSSSMHQNLFETPLEDKKEYKRAANRKSAQLSRKRKKAYIEELKDENDALRRKEQILRSIPDLVVVFDSSGKLLFVSESVCRFLQFTASELEGKSFWERICQDSVRLVKAAFMDSLAARTEESDTAPLGEGIWGLRLLDKDGTQRFVALHGVVHFAGDSPECVCTIRLRDEEDTRSKESSSERKMATDTTATAVSSGSSTDTSGFRNKSMLHINPQQRVWSTDTGTAKSRGAASAVLALPKKKAKRDLSIRISDSCNSSSSGDNNSSED